MRGRPSAALPHGGGRLRTPPPHVGNLIDWWHVLISTCHGLLISTCRGLLICTSCFNKSSCFYIPAQSMLFLCGSCSDRKLARSLPIWQEQVLVNLGFWFFRCPDGWFSIFSLRKISGKAGGEMSRKKIKVFWIDTGRNEWFWVPFLLHWNSHLP